MKDDKRFWNDATALQQTAKGEVSRLTALIGGIGLGAIFMYFFDPRTGRRRRALLRDQLAHLERVLGRAQQVTARDIANRTSGILAESTRWLRNGAAGDDDVLAARVRARLGRVVSHPHAISVNASAHDGVVIVSGPILAAEVVPLLDAVGDVPGVRRIENRLEAHEDARKISALQGGRPRYERFELLQDRWSPSARTLVGAFGAGLIAHGARSGGPLGFVSALFGGGLILRAAANLDTRRLLGFGDDRRGIDIQKTVHVAAPVEDVFDFWSDYGNFPRFMSRVRDVRILDETRSRWTVAGPGGVPVHWTAEVTNVVPNSLIEWRSEPGSVVRHHGVVRFDEDGGQGTRVHVQLCYVPPGGVLGHALASFLCADPKSDMDEDLMRMKSMIESGHAPHDAAQPLSAETLRADVAARAARFETY